MTGKFITLEGGEGAGKTSQGQMLVEALRRRGIDVVATREPGGCPGAELLREMLLHPPVTVTWTAHAEALLHFAARAQHIEKVIRPALAAGQWVVSDRFYDSTLAYQGYGQHADREIIRRLIGMVALHPDLTIVLDVTEQEATNRLHLRRGQSDRYEREGLLFHARVRDGFRTIASIDADRCVLIPADGPKEEIHAQIMEVVADRLLQANRKQMAWQTISKTDSK